VNTAELGEEFWFTTKWRGHDSIAWTYGMKPTSGGTTLTESYEVHGALGGYGDLPEQAADESDDQDSASTEGAHLVGAAIYRSYIR
jgi:hypothetical protein